MNRSQVLAALAVILGASTSAPARADSPSGVRRKGALDGLHDYLEYNRTPRDIDPADFISYLRQQPRFKTIDLSSIPRHAIILHDASPEEQLDRLGIDPESYVAIQTGSTDPNVLYVVRSEQHGDFVLNRGLPGAGGITTQAAELFALGVLAITHVGTCGLIGKRIPGGKPIISAGAYKDAAGVMLSIDPSERLARPDPNLGTVLRNGFAAAGIAVESAIGYTSPIYYFQPAGLVRALAAQQGTNHVEYVEMEAGSLFAVASLMKRAAASVVIGVDRYTPTTNGLGKHQYLNVDDRKVKHEALVGILSAYRQLRLVPQ